MRANLPSAGRLRRRLLAWFDAHRRCLPWRRTGDPYRIWLAEIMLQQTRVPVAIPYYRRFLRAFPSVRSVARAREDAVLKLWAGLGYYQRARNLRCAAKLIVKRHGGRFPQTLAEALALPGVGPYTARAILSIAYRQPQAVVDGNVARALIRLFRLKGADPNNRGALQSLADRLVSPARPGDFNQALMELGSTVCLPRNPRCGVCPLEKLCAARRAGVEQSIPARQAARRRPRLTLSVLVARRNGRVLLARESRGLFSGLWHFPYARAATARRLARALGASSLVRVATLEHQTTMRDLVLRVFTARAGGVSPNGGGARWARLGEVERLGVGAATRKIAAAVIERERARAD